jgi:hypothetical protein
VRPADDLTVLEAHLADLATALEFPPTPPLRATVLERIRTGPGIATRPAPLRRRVGAAVLAAVVAIAASLAIPRWRDALAGWLGIHGVTIEQSPSPPPTPTPSIPPTLGPPGSGLGLGDPVSAAAAATSLDFAPLVPTSLGIPDSEWLRTSPSGTALSLVYIPAPGRPPASSQTGVSILITELRADVDTRYLGKLAGPDTTITQVTVRGEPGAWLAGAPHAVFYVTPEGPSAPDELRLATNTLLWQHGPILVRIEGLQSLEQAQAIAASMG